MNQTRGDQKVLGPICFGEIYWIKIFASRPFDPNVKSIEVWKACGHAWLLMQSTF